MSNLALQHPLHTRLPESLDHLRHERVTARVRPEQQQHVLAAQRVRRRHLLLARPHLEPQRLVAKQRQQVHVARNARHLQLHGVGYGCSPGAARGGVADARAPGPLRARSRIRRAVRMPILAVACRRSRCCLASMLPTCWEPSPAGVDCEGPLHLFPWLRCSSAVEGAVSEKRACGAQVRWAGK
eukprot:365032-Chlamydomonas_euryale.AAC.8